MRFRNKPTTIGRDHVLHNNFVEALAWLVRNEGVMSLARGILPRIMIAGPSSAATFIAYEHALSLATTASK